MRRNTSYMVSWLGLIRLTREEVFETKVRVNSVNCIKGSRSCSWPAANIPLRDRRAKKQPGEQAPWTIQSVLTSQSARSSSSSISPEINQKRMAPSSSFKIALGDALDPFDAMHIKMPFKSKELLHYCEFMKNKKNQQQRTFQLFINYNL